MLRGQPDPTRLHLLRAAPAAPSQCAACCLSLALARSFSLSPPPQMSTLRDLAPGHGFCNPDVPFPAETSSPLRRALGPRRCHRTLSFGTWETEGVGSCLAGEGQAESCDADPSKSPFQRRGQGHTRSLPGAEPRRLYLSTSSLSRTHTHRYNRCLPAPDLPSPLRVLKSKSDQCLLTLWNPGGSSSQSLCLSPLCGCRRPGVKFRLSFSPKAPSWYFIFLIRVGWR